MYLLPLLKPKTLEEIARQPDVTEELAKREAEQVAKVWAFSLWPCSMPHRHLDAVHMGMCLGHTKRTHASEGTSSASGMYVVALYPLESHAYLLLCS